MPSGAQVFVASVVQAHQFFQIHFLAFRLFSFCLIAEKNEAFDFFCVWYLYKRAGVNHFCSPFVLPTSAQKRRTNLSIHASTAGQKKPEADPKTRPTLFFLKAKSIIAWWFSRYNRSLIYSCCSADLKRSIQVEPGRFTFQRSASCRRPYWQKAEERRRESEAAINLLLSFTILQCAAAVAADKNWIYLYSFFFFSLAPASFLPRWLSVSQTPGWRYDHSGAGGETQAGMEEYGGGVLGWVAAENGQERGNAVGERQWDARFPSADRKVIHRNTTCTQFCRHDLKKTKNKQSW